ncbi:MAG: hypothetical protein QXT63_09525, partial [Thermoplasmata archaeon]
KTSIREVVEDVFVPILTEIMAGAIIDEMLDRMVDCKCPMTVGITNALKERLPDLIYVTLSNLPAEERNALIEVIDETIEDIENEGLEEGLEMLGEGTERVVEEKEEKKEEEKGKK